MGIELQFKDVEALEAMLANSDELSMKSLEGVQGGGFGHSRCLVDNQRIARCWLSSDNSVGNVRSGSACRVRRQF